MENGITNFEEYDPTKIKSGKKLTKLVKWQNQSRYQVISHRKLEDVYKSRILKSKKVKSICFMDFTEDLITN
jgi:hypothetical protein